MKKDASRASESELSKATIRALKKVMDSLEQEPSVVIVLGDDRANTCCPSDEITSWLFHRRDDNGSSSN